MVSPAGKERIASEARILGPRRSGGRPAGGDPGATRARILEAAAEQFATAGVREASMAQIAQAAGISPSSIYNHFSSKTALWIAAACDMYAEIGRSLRAADEPARHWRERLIILSDACVNLYREDGVLQWFGIQSKLEAYREPERFHMVFDRIQEVNGIFVEIAQSASECGDIPKHVSPQLLGEALCAMLMDAISVNIMVDPGAARFAKLIEIFQIAVVKDQ